MIGQQLARSTFKSNGPLERFNIMTTPSVRVQVVHEIPTADDKHTVITQRRQTLAQFVMKRRRLIFIDAELDNGHIGFRNSVTEHRPRAVVETPTLIRSDRNWGKQFANTCR